MSARERQRRLHVEGRLADLRAKYGREDALQEWGEGWWRAPIPDFRNEDAERKFWESRPDVVLPPMRPAREVDPRLPPPRAPKPVVNVDDLDV